MTERMMEATYDGRTYSIPEMWVAGITLPRGDTRYTIQDAIAIWAYQQELSELDSAS